MAATSLEETITHDLKTQLRREPEMVEQRSKCTFNSAKILISYYNNTINNPQEVGF